MELAAAERKTATEIRDEYSLTYFVLIVLVGLLFVSAHDLDRIFHLWLMLLPIVFLPAFAMAIYCLVALARNIWLRRWRRVASVLAAPIAGYVIFAGASAAGVNPERVRFEIGKRYYVDQIAALPQIGEPRFKLFDWGGTGGAGVPNFVYTLIYDESDEISLPRSERSRAWQDRAKKLCPGAVMCSISRPPLEISVTVSKAIFI